MGFAKERRTFVQHLDRLNRRGIVSVFRTEFFCDPPGFHLGRVNLEKLGNRCGLIRGKKPLPKLGFAKVGLIHLRGSGNDAQRKFLCLAHLPEPFSERGWWLSLSSHRLARYIGAWKAARRNLRVQEIKLGTDNHNSRASPKRDLRKKHLGLLLRGGEDEAKQAEAFPAVASCVHFQTAWFKLRA